MIRKSYGAVVERNVEWNGAFETEPYEVGWASEAIFFVRALRGGAADSTARVQITPDGMNWCDEGSSFLLPGEGAVTCCKLTNFGNWLRIVGSADSPITVIVTLTLKE